MRLTDNSLVKEKGFISSIVDIVRNIEKIKVNPSELGEGLQRMKVSSRFQFTELLCNMMDKGNVILFDDEDYKISMIPFIPFYDKESKRFKCAVNIRQFTSSVKNITTHGITVKQYDIDERRLHAVLIYAMGCIVGLSSDGFASNGAIRDHVVKYQVYLWLTIINRMGSLGTEDNISLLKYMVAKWILSTQYGMTDENKLRGTANKAAEGVSNVDLILKVDMSYPNLNVSMSEFLTILEKEFPQLNGKLDITYILRAGNTYLSGMNIICLEYPVTTIGLIMTYMSEFAEVNNNKTFMKELLTESRECYNILKGTVIKYAFSHANMHYSESLHGGEI